jgi:nuclear pore complex protein Nup93
MLHSSTTDPFKLALYKLMGKIDPSKRTVPDVTVTTEDWLWFQLAMVRTALDRFAPALITVSQLDEEEFGGLRGLSDVVSGYGQRHFDGPPNQRGSRKGVWAAVLTMCGQFERVCQLQLFPLSL